MRHRSLHGGTPEQEIAILLDYSKGRGKHHVSEKRFQARPHGCRRGRRGLKMCFLPPLFCSFLPALSHRSKEQVAEEAPQVAGGVDAERGAGKEGDAHKLFLQFFLTWGNGARLAKDVESFVTRLNARCRTRHTMQQLIDESNNRLQSQVSFFLFTLPLLPARELLQMVSHSNWG